MQSIQDEFVKWQGWMKRIEDDIGNRLVVPRQIHRKFVEVVNANIDHLTEHSGWHFADFVRCGYAAQVASGIRRHVKSKDDSVSLMRLLKQLAENARRFTYEFFCSSFQFVRIMCSGNSRRFRSPATTWSDAFGASRESRHA